MQILSIINKRSISLCGASKSNSPDNEPDVLPPELIVRGYEILVINVMPPLQYAQDEYTSDQKPVHSYPASHRPKRPLQAS